MNNNYLAMVALSISIAPAGLNAEESFLTQTLPTIVKNVGEGVEVGEGEKVLRQEVQNYSLGVANSAVDRFEQNVLANTNFTHFELTIGSDVLGLSGDEAKTKTEAMTVYRLHEDKNTFVFNQASVVRFDDRTTLNIGLGARYINDAETVIAGANVFYDYEIESKHKRGGFGVELLTSMLEFRANKYNAISGAISYKGVQEAALDGHDVKVTANMPYFYTSNFYYKLSEFSDNAGYSMKSNEWGVQAEVLPNLVFGLAQQKRDGFKEQQVASISYSIPLGGPRRAQKQMQDGVWSTKLKPIRDKLYQPVQRENRIMKKAIKMNVTVSGY